MARLGLVTAYGHVSARAGEVMLITPAADLASVTASQVVAVPLTGTPPLPAGVPAEAWAHLALYRARPDVAAIARAQPVSGLAAAATTTSLVPLHGQAAWLGESVPVHDSAALLRSPELAERAARSLPVGEAAGRRVRDLPGRARGQGDDGHGVRHAVRGHPAVRGRDRLMACRRRRTAPPALASPAAPLTASVLMRRG